MVAGSNTSATLSAFNSPTSVASLLETIEMSFDERRVVPWMQSHWHWSFYYCTIYLLLIFFGQKYMKDKKSYNLRTALCCWSASLSLFSIYASYRVLPIAYNMVYLGGIRHAVCDISPYIGSNGSGMWAFLFPFSKLLELVDTFFIVARKQKMVFLHWYHHVTVFIYCWFSYAFPISTGIWFGIVNFIVHAIMYAYYAVRASGRSPPKWVAQTITAIQISQMFAGVLLNYLTIKSLLQNKTCDMTAFSIGMSIFFYVSYAILFGNFYYWSYIHKKPRQAGAVTKALSNGIANGHSHLNGISKRTKLSLSNGNGFLSEHK